jgi:hypothetical protein
MRAHEFIQDLIAAAQKSGTNVTINIGSINIDSRNEKPVNDVKTAFDTDRFIPPLQQKIELMKKQTGTESSDPLIAHDDDFPDD